MIIGQTLLGGTFSSPWIPKEGDAALFPLEVIAANGTLTMIVQTKKLEDPDPPSKDSGSILGSIVEWREGGVKALSGSDVSELVRYWYVVSGVSSCWVHFRVLPPAWRMN